MQGMGNVFHRISIHAPRGGSDWSPLRVRPLFVISIHAPRGGSDSSGDRARINCTDFNPRSPWGERLALDRKILGILDFNPRSPWGERLVQPWMFGHPEQFQSTLPVGGATLCPLFTKSNL